MSCIGCHNRQVRNEGSSAMTSNTAGAGTAEDPWILATPPGKSDFEAWRDEDSDPPALVVQVGNADEQKPAADGTVEAWGRSADNPVRGWYGVKKGLRGRFGNYVPPILEALGLAEVEHNPR